MNIEPGLGELLDRLSIDLIKQVKQPEKGTAYHEEIAAILKDVDAVYGERGVKLSARQIRLLIALAQINLYIWEAKDELMDDDTKFRYALRLSHQQNGIRNQAKVALETEVDSPGSAGVPTNTSREDLDGWRFSILDGSAR